MGVNSTTASGGALVFNADQTGSPSSSSTNWSYITVERGLAPDVSIRWNESTDKWQFTNNGSTYADFVTADTDTGILNVVEDLTPQLGGDLDVNSKKITAIGTYGEIPIEVNINSVATELVKFGYDPVNPTTPVAARYGTTFTDKVWIEANQNQQLDLYAEVTTPADITSDAGIYMNFTAIDGTSTQQTRVTIAHQNNFLSTLVNDRNNTTVKSQITHRPTLNGLSWSHTTAGSVTTNYDVVTEYNAESVIAAETTYFTNTVRFAAGAYLGGTGDANKLDDYEEGTFTPVLSDASAGGNLASLANVRAVYTKIGNQVTVHLNLNNITTTGMTAGNAVYIQGLPFTPPSYASPNLNYLGTVRLQNVTFTGNVIGRLQDNNSYMILQDIATGATATDLLVSDITSGTADIGVSLTYETT